MTNRQVILASYVQGVPAPHNFSVIESEVPTPRSGEFVVRNLYFSLEAAIRSWLSGQTTYFEPIPLGGVIRGPTLGRVVESRHPNFDEGDLVWGLNQWEDYSLLNSNTILLKKIETRPGVPFSYYAGVLGGSGQTAYVGLHEIGKIRSGQTVVVSAAAGATGSVAAQIARLRDCKVVGIVGSESKARIITKELGVDVAVNYRETPDIAAEVQQICPEGVDIYYDNVGGKTLDAMLTCMKDFGRIVACGMISDYNNQSNPTPIKNLWKIVEKQLAMQGFLLPSFEKLIPTAEDALHKWLERGELRVLENITYGIENAGAAYCRMMEGDTIGKNLVQVASLDSI